MDEMVDYYTIYMTGYDILSSHIRTETAAAALDSVLHCFTMTVLSPLRTLHSRAENLDLPAVH